ncbi:hypothetical protein ACFQV4_22110 [Streptomyces thermocarboxydus]
MVTAVVQAAQLSSQAGSEQKLEVFVNLARRLQSSSTARSPSSTSWRTRWRTPTCSRGSSTSTTSPPASAATRRTSPCSAGPSPAGSGATRCP